MLLFSGVGWGGGGVGGGWDKPLCNVKDFLSFQETTESFMPTKILGSFAISAIRKHSVHVYLILLNIQLRF